MRIEQSPLGLTAVDATGFVAGRVEGTYPYDGSDFEFALVRLGRGRFGQMRMVPLRGAQRYDSTLQFPFTFAEMESAPSVERSRYGVDQADDARAYWLVPS
jgi:hypothetical protein